VGDGCGLVPVPFVAVAMDILIADSDPIVIVVVDSIGTLLVPDGCLRTIRRFCTEECPDADDNCCIFFGASATRTSTSLCLRCISASKFCWTATDPRNDVDGVSNAVLDGGVNSAVADDRVGVDVDGVLILVVFIGTRRTLRIIFLAGAVVPSVLFSVPLVPVPLLSL
jgi:hypothetical protein